MAGTEAVGLVLGAIPLIISALEHYDDIMEPAKAFMRWKHHLSRLTRELYIVRASYDQAIRLLLKPCADLGEQAGMMDDPQNKLWTEGDIADALRERLGPVYDALLLMVKEVSEILVTIVTCLNVPGSQQVIKPQNLAAVVSSNSPVANTPFPQKNFSFGQRVRFTMKKSHVKDALSRLEVCTTRIDAWSIRAGKLHEDTFQSRAKLRFCASINTIQENAGKIYQAVRQNWCTEDQIHTARLLLEQRLVRSKKRKFQKSAISNSAAQPSRFGLGISGQCHSTPRWLNFDIGVEESMPICTDTTSITLSMPAGDEPSPDLHDVTDLCGILKQPVYPAIGFRVDSDGSLKSYSPPKKNDKFASESLSLKAVLPQSEIRPSIVDTYELAITLIASLFQLSRTPWLGVRWSKEDISFPRLKDSSPLSVDLKLPYFVKHFDQKSSTKAEATRTNTDCDNLLGLAIMLLEIVCGRAIEQRHQQTNHPSADNVSNLHHADEWLKDEKACGRLSCAFYQAILTCLQQYLNPDADFSDSKYCDMFKEKALLPLEEEMGFLLHGHPR